MKTTEIDGIIKSGDAAFGYALGSEDAKTPFYTELAPHLLFVPEEDGYREVDVSVHLEKPTDWEHITEPNFSHPASLGAYVKDHLKPGTRVFAYRAQGRFTAFLDYEDADGSPLWGRHTAGMKCNPSPEWKAWSDLSGKPKGQEEFAEFLEDWAHTVIEPEAAKLHEVVLAFEQTTKVFFKSTRSLSSGMVQVEYSETHDSAGKNVTMPSEIVLALRPYEFSSPYKVKAQLRYRIRDGKLALSVHLRGLDRVIEEAWSEVCQAVENTTGISVYRCQ